MNVSYKRLVWDDWAGALENVERAEDLLRSALDRPDWTPSSRELLLRQALEAVADARHALEDKPQKFDETYPG